MKVIAVMDSIISPISTVKGGIKEGEIYTVKSEQSGYSSFGKRMVDAYEFYEVDGLYEKGIFIPLSDKDESEFDRMLRVCLSTEPINKKLNTGKEL